MANQSQMLERILSLLQEIDERTEQMAIDQATFDTDLAALVAAINTLIDAVNAAIAAKPAADLTAEDQSVQTAAAAVSAELASITPPPAP